MTKKRRKKTKKGSSAPKGDGLRPASEGTGDAAAPPAAATLGAGRVVRKKVPKPSRKEKAALAKKEARAKYAARMEDAGL